MGGVSVSLKDKLLLNFYMKIQNGASPSEYWVRYKHNDTVSERVCLDTLGYSSTNGYYINVPVTAKQMTDEYRAWVEDAEGNQVSNVKVYSVEKYCKSKIEKGETATGDEAEKARALGELCKAILNYGAYAQITLKYNTGTLANRSLSETDKDVSGVAVPENVKVTEGSIAGILIQTTLSLKEATIVRFKITLDEGEDIGAYTFDVTGSGTVDWGVEQEKNNIYNLDIRGVAAKNLDNRYTVTVTKENVSTVMTVEYGALVYLYNNREQTDRGLGDLCRAMYAYHTTAKDYFARYSN
jgi:hypothetical protein